MDSGLYSTWWALHNASDSPQSGRVSIIRGAPIVDGGDGLLGPLAQPVGQGILRGGTLVQVIFFDGLLYYGFILPHLAVKETVLQPNAGPQPLRPVHFSGAVCPRASGRGVVQGAYALGLSCLGLCALIWPSWGCCLDIEAEGETLCNFIPSNAKATVASTCMPAPCPSVFWTMLGRAGCIALCHQP